MNASLTAESPRGVKRKAEADNADASGTRRIQALDPNVVNKIAAGEIIIAPVHALKELVENAVDAGSTMLEVLVKDGGLKLLQITDNGCGIDKEDLAILCERFTTSKLQTFEDLESIQTYGFRGEALASISHIAHLTVTTRTKDSDSAWRAYYEAGKLAPIKPGQGIEPRRVAGRQGTQITVEDLFYNVPTRRRAFRSTSDEYNKIVDMIGRYAVHCSHVAFACKKHGESSASISIQATASTVDRIRHVYGGAVASELLPFETEDSRWGFKASGWATNANFSMKRTTLLLFINGRSVESTNIRKMLDEMYAAFLPKNSHPFVYLSLEIDPQRVDVNVHPTKRQVNFLNEDEISRAICEHISAKLAEVDTSRTFSTQSLLSTGTLSSSSRTNLTVGGLAPATPSGPSVGTPVNALKRTPVRPYENNLVRTDTNMRKITSMFAPSHPAIVHMSPSATKSVPERDGSDPQTDSDAIQRRHLLPRANDYEVVDREVTVNWLKSVRELKKAVVDTSSSELTEVFKTYSFVGIVDERRRLAAIQSGVKLYLVDYGRACFELFYQMGLNDFGNFGVIRFSPPLDLQRLLRLAYHHERGQYGEDDDDCREEDIESFGDTDADKAVRAVAAQLIERRQMLQEYFSLEVTPSGELLSIPLLIKGYTPALAKLPQFLLNLGPRVRWDDEKGCFDTLLRELASFYVPERLPFANEERQRYGQQQALKKSKSKEKEMSIGDGNYHDNDNDNDNDDRASGDSESDEDVQARRSHVQYAVEHVLFPAFKTKLICTTSLMQAGLIEVANLKGLYRVFERC
ncbi:MAG: DNA mismatch repair protein Mlh1 [Sporothrix epigloea]